LKRFIFGICVTFAGVFVDMAGTFVTSGSSN